MRVSPVPAALTVGLLLGLAQAATADAPAAGLAWQTDLGRARAAARRDGKPLLVVFR